MSKFNFYTNLNGAFVSNYIYVCLFIEYDHQKIYFLYHVLEKT